MDERAAADLAELTTLGVFTRAQAHAAGVDDPCLQRWCRGGQLHRIRRGVYVDKAQWRAADSVQQHLLASRAVLLRLADDARLTSVSALVLLDVPLLAANLSRVHVSREGPNGRIQAGTVHHDGEVPARWTTTVQAIPTVAPAWAAVEVARAGSCAQGVAAMDMVLQRRQATRDELRAVLEYGRGWSGARRARRAFDLSDGRSESVGESRARLVLNAVGLPPDSLQEQFPTDRGSVRVDFYWKDAGVVGEFDGRIKYGRLADEAGLAPAEVAWQERQRELAIERTGRRVFRLTWADLDRRDTVLRYARAAFNRAVSAGATAPRPAS